MASDTMRRYAGQSADDRVRARRASIVAAGLQVLGTEGAAALTVRRVIADSGLAPRYFYESFRSLDELELAVFDSVVAEVQEAAIAALASARRRPRARIQAVLHALCALLLDDPRKGRVVLVEALASPALGPRRLAEAERFAGLLAEFSADVWRGLDPDAGQVVVTAQFAVGGLAETLAKVLNGHLTLDRARLVDYLTELFLGTGVAFGAMTGKG